jgi:hypothetical protein
MFAKSTEARVQQPRPPYRCSQIRRGADVVMSGIVESGHGDIDANAPKPKCKSSCRCEKSALSPVTIAAASCHFGAEVACLSSRSDDFEVFRGDTGCAATGIEVG